MTATPHNGKEEDFQLFMALLDGDRFEGKFRDGVHAADVSDLMRRMVKENLLKFDGTPLFPERIAYTVPYKLSDAEAALYKAVTEYVREEFNRAEALENDKRAGTVGFALTILQRRLASSPEAIYQSLRRRRERLESRLRELEVLQRGGQVAQRARCAGPAPRHGRRRGSGRRARRRGGGCRGGGPRPGDGGALDRRAADRDRDAEASRRPRAVDPAQRRRQEVARAGDLARRDLHPGVDRQRLRGRRGALRRWRADAAEAHAVAASEAGHLHRAPRHAELPASADQDAARPGGGRRHDPRRHGPRGAHEGAGSLQARSRSAGAAGDRRRWRRHQSPARPPDGELRSALEPEPARAALRPHPPHRPDRGLPPLEPGRRGDARRRRLPQAARKAGSRRAARSAARSSTCSASCSSKGGRCANC